MARRRNCLTNTDPLIGRVKRDYNVDYVRLSGIVIGAIGGWLDSNEVVLKNIGIRNTALYKYLRA